MPETANSVEQNQSQAVTTKLDELDTVKLNFLINRLIEKDKEEQKKAEELQQKQQEEEAAAATEESTQQSIEEKELQDSVDRENAQHAELVTELKKTNETLTADSGSNTQEDLLAEIKVTNDKLQTVIENQSSATVYQENSYSLGTLAFAGFIACVGAYVSFKACSVIVSFVKQAFR